MSRSNPTGAGAPNPATRRFEWNGELGSVKYYDKDTKKNVEVGDNFPFVLLDETASVGGWSDEYHSGIYSNEVKDTRSETLTVKVFKGAREPIAKGFYKDIKPAVNDAGGSYQSNLYIAFKNDQGEMAIGKLTLKGAALSAWMEFRKENRAKLMTYGVKISGSTEGKKGRVIFRTPDFELVNLTDETNEAATALDVILQEYFSGRSTASAPASGGGDVDDDDAGYGDGDEGETDIDDEDIPF